MTKMNPRMTPTRNIWNRKALRKIPPKVFPCLIVRVSCFSFAVLLTVSVSKNVQVMRFVDCQVLVEKN